ncbi:MAG: TraR/DksA C4-type zinc finger protein [Parcubacteria group bacterium]
MKPAQETTIGAAKSVVSSFPQNAVGSSSAQLSLLRSSLEKKKKEAERRIAFAEGDDHKGHEPANQHEVCDKKASKIKMDTITIQDCDAAIRRMDEGTGYGICIDCREPIGFARLELIPEAKRCTPCQEKKSIKNGNHK